MENLALLVPSGLSIATLLWVLYDRRKSGVSDVQADVTKYYQERRNQQDEKIRDQDAKILAFAAEVARISAELAGLKATILEKEKYIVSLTETLQGRNPEMIDLLHKIEDALAQNLKFMEGMQEFMKVMHRQNKGILDYQTAMLEKGEKRSEKIDKASVEQEGAPMRVPEEIVE